MKIDWTAEELEAKQNECNSFAREHIYVLCKELIEWQDTAVIPEGGRLLELAQICEWAGSSKLRVAESFVSRIAYESLIKHIDWHRA